MKKLIFKNDGTDFSGITSAETWLHEQRYSTGSMQAGAPTGIAKGDMYIAKWRNISRNEYSCLDGIIEAGDYRNGNVTVTLKENETEIITDYIIRAG